MARQVEHGLQVAVARLLELCLDPALTWWSGIDHAARLGARYGADRKRRGVKRGIPDFLILVKGQPALGIEIKSETGRVSPEQKELRDDWRAIDHRYVICRSLGEVQQALNDNNVPMLRQMMVGRR
jgi:hypothetical protein